MITEQKLLTVKQTAERLGVNRQRVLQLISANRLPAQKIGSYYTIFESDVEALNRQERKAGRPPKNQGSTNGNPQAETPFKTAFDVVPHLIGKHHSGIGDLSTNKKYLEGLGTKAAEKEGLAKRG